MVTTEATMETVSRADRQSEAKEDGSKECTDFSGFLKALDADCQQKLETLLLVDAGDSRDPLFTAMAAENEQSQLRQARAKSRSAAMDKKKDEADWHERIQRRKEAERRRAAEEAIAAAEALEAAMQTVHEEVDNTPLGVARRNWAANDRARNQARAQEAEVHDLGVRAWLDDEWLPRLECHRQQLRAQRAADQQQLQEVQQALQRERDAMVREDAASASFVAFVVDECERLSRRMQMKEDPAVQAKAHAVWTAVEARSLRAREHEARRKEAEEAARRQESEKQEREYREWKREVRNVRCCRKRFENQDDITTPNRDLEERTRLGLEGCDYIREKAMVDHEVLEDALQRATADAGRLKESGHSPRRVLEEARNRAVLEKKKREKCEPTNVEQELWEVLLAKNRHARQQERASLTPRWGIFAT